MRRLFTTCEAAAIGLTSNALRWGEATGRWRRVRKGVYVDGQIYVRGDMATFGGSQWHCDAETTAKPGESKDWTLVVKRGRDGAPGRDAPGALPVVKR